MPNSRFNVGDRVKCINATYSRLVEGRIYEVLKVTYSPGAGEWIVQVEEDGGEWFETRFEPEVRPIEVTTYQIYYKNYPNTTVYVIAVREENEIEAFKEAIRRASPNPIFLGIKKIKVKFPGVAAE